MSGTTTPTESPSVAPSPPTLTAPAVAANSPALVKYGKARVGQALDLAAHLAYLSVADPKLLVHAAPHTSISDYSDITQYLTPRGISYLQGYIRDQDRNSNDGVTAAQLAFALLPPTKTDSTSFDMPFAPRNYRATLNPVVNLGRNGSTMVVSGRCSIQIPGTHDGKRTLVKLTRTYFTYYVQPEASKAYPLVGVYGWNSHSTLVFAHA